MSVRSKLAAVNNISSLDVIRFENKKRVYSLLRDKFIGTRKGAPRRDVENKMKRLQGNPDIDALSRVFPEISILNYALLFVSKGLFEVDKSKSLTYLDAVRAARLASAREPSVPGEKLPILSVPEKNVKWEESTPGADAPRSDLTEASEAESAKPAESKQKPAPDTEIKRKPGTYSTDTPDPDLTAITVPREKTNQSKITTSAKDIARIYFDVKHSFRNTPKDIANRFLIEKVSNLAKVDETFGALKERYGLDILTAVIRRLVRQGHFLVDYEVHKDYSDAVLAAAKLPEDEDQITIEKIPANEPFVTTLDSLLHDHLESSKDVEGKHQGSGKFKLSDGRRPLATQQKQDADTLENDNIKAEKAAYSLEEVAPSVVLPWSIVNLPDMNEIEPPNDHDIIPDTGRMRLFEMLETSVPVDGDMADHLNTGISKHPISERIRDSVLLTSIVPVDRLNEHRDMSVSRPSTSECTRLPYLQELGYDLDPEHKLDLNGLRLYTPNDAETSGSLHILEPAEAEDDANQKLQASVILEDAIAPTALSTFVADPVAEANEDQSVVGRKDSKIEEGTVDQQATNAASLVSEPVLEQVTKSYLSRQMQDGDTKSPVAEGISEKIPTFLKSSVSDQTLSPKGASRKRRMNSSVAIYKYKPIQATTETQHTTPHIKLEPEKSADEKGTPQTEEVEITDLDKQEATIAISEGAAVVADLPDDNHAKQSKQSQEAPINQTTLRKGEESLDIGPERMRNRVRSVCSKNSKESDIHTEISKNATLPVPKTYALYLPYSAQHKLLTHLQTSLEAACFGYLKRNHPSLFRGTDSLWEIDCPESLELTQYIELFTKHVEFDSETTSKHLERPIASLYHSLIQLRHYAVHRKRGSIELLRTWNNDAYTFAMLLGDPQAAGQFNHLSCRLARTHSELNKKKAKYEGRLLETVKELAVKRAELDRLEKEAIERFVEDDKVAKDCEAAHMDKALFSLLPESEEMSSPSSSSSATEPPTGLWGWCKSWFGAR